MFLTPTALMALRTAEAAGGKMTLALHQNTSARAGFRPSLEGWAKAGIAQVEITNNLLDDFLKTDSLAAARRVFTDLRLKPVSGSCGVTGLIDPNPNRASSLDRFKQRCEMWATLGITHIYSTTASTIKPTADDYKAAAGNVRDVGEVARQFQLTAMFEFVRTSTFVSTLTTLLSITRAAAHANVGPMFDCYHFWSGLNRLEDLDTLRPGEIKHVHFQDVPDMPREMARHDDARHSGRRRDAAQRHPAQARGEGLRGPSFRRALSAEVPAGRSVRGGARDQGEERGGHATGEGPLIQVASYFAGTRRFSSSSQCCTTMSAGGAALASVPGALIIRKR
jgi:sugar phosphate isomerase/epimerase